MSLLDDIVMRAAQDTHVVIRRHRDEVAADTVLLLASTAMSSSMSIHFSAMEAMVSVLVTIRITQVECVQSYLAQADTVIYLQELGRVSKLAEVLRYYHIPMTDDLDMGSRLRPLHAQRAPNHAPKVP